LRYFFYHLFWSEILGKIAIAIAKGAIVVTRDRVDFGEIVGLKIEGWTV
jgi:hypothetical protein